VGCGAGSGLLTWEDGEPCPDFPTDPNCPLEIKFPVEKWLALVNGNHIGVLASYPPGQKLSGNSKIGFVMDFCPGGAENSHYFTMLYYHASLPVTKPLRFSVYIAVGNFGEFFGEIRTFLQT
jgi:hypothetical protein